jgi:hypothetical protein
MIGRRAAVAVARLREVLGQELESESLDESDGVAGVRQGSLAELTPVRRRTS